ncbi:conjugal transfer protein TraG N-terminal domain-containing protein [Muribacter muris]|uniref:conjugal transfer protein TraG N-terminal domain-containing protein n=1 Tax=Muribacter muris TaxID=67855 RepID=UPI001ADDC8E0|nr:conjugal transfer protein TraG N-terminal domain-containing protein [Muribacter muris]
MTDSSLYQALYGHLGGNGNIIDDVAEFFREGDEHASMNMVLNSMYLVIPALWIGFLSWAGVKVGNGISSAIQGGAKEAKSGTNDGINTSKSVVK